MSFLKEHYELITDQVIMEGDEEYVCDLKDVWIQTYSGKKINPFQKSVLVQNNIDIIDIAHSLSNICRFTGHSKFFYSVAQHSVFVSRLCEEKAKENNKPENQIKNYALAGLLHDGSEAYLQDIPSPIKNSGVFKIYKSLESYLQDNIYHKYRLWVDNSIIKECDLIMLETEAAQLMSPLHQDWQHTKFNPCDIIIEEMSPKEAKKIFLDRFDELTNHEK